MFKKSLLIKLHLYSGLFTAFYLLAFGFSALVLNHNVKLDNNEFTKTWETEMTIDSSLPDQQLAESIRDGIGIMGWLPRWQFKRDSATFAFGVTHLGRNFRIAANLQSGKIEVKEAPKGLLAVFNGLHFLNGRIPNAPLLIRTWAIYQWFALFVMAISLILGLWLWIKYNYKVWQGWAFGGLFIITIITMILL